jgi:hypothetical protein
MLGQRALKTEGCEELIVDLNPFRDLRKSLPLSHFAEELSPVLVICLLIGHRLAACDERQPEPNTGISRFISLRNSEIDP